MLQRLWTVTVELRDGTEYSATVRASTGPQARELLNQAVNPQYTKSTRPMRRSDSTLPRLNW